MGITLLTRTKLGLWSVMLYVAKWVVFIIGSLLPAKTGLTGIDIILQNPLPAFAQLIYFIFGLAAPILALIAVIRMKERSIFVLLVIPSLLTGLISILGMIMVVFFGMVP